MMAVTDASLYEGFKRAYYNSVVFLPTDVKGALEDALARESSPRAKLALDVILQNINMAREERMVVCQDTGIAEFTVRIGKGFDFQADPSLAAVRAVQEVTAAMPLIPHCVHPLTRHNPGTNTGYGVPIIHYELDSSAPYLEIIATPAAGVCIPSVVEHTVKLSRIKEMVLDCVWQAGGGCPPFIVGIGIGGPYDVAMKLARKAAFRTLDRRHPDPDVAGLEQELLVAVNGLGMGTMNLGGDVTALAVNIEVCGAHRSCNPVAVRLECWCMRRGVVRIHPDASIEEIA